MDTLRLLATILPLALTSGINLYATILIVGLSIRLEWVPNPPAGLDALGSWVVIIVAGVFYLVEFLADKIPVVDNVWDMIHTFIRPFGAALVAFSVVVQMDPIVAVLSALAAGGVALVSHGGKAGSRMVMNVTSPAENISNIVVSLAEDVGAGLLAFLALKYPWAAAGVAIILLVLIILFVPRILSWGWYNLKAFGVWIKGLVSQVEESETLPANHLIVLQHQRPDLSSACKGQGIPGANGRNGYLSIQGSELAFTYESWGRSHAWRMPVANLAAAYLRHRLFVDVLELHSAAGSGKPKVFRFVFLKDRMPLVDAFAERLNATETR
ncbi:MAG TPA: DUF4126 domain-containing protein [Anaerolineaceae bacterium]|nr:DUF4126 domain-containing protein [Anaerolineaceae bacterium]